MKDQQITQLSILGVVSIVGLIAAIGLLSTPSTNTAIPVGGGQQDTVVGQQGFWNFGNQGSDFENTDMGSTDSGSSGTTSGTNTGTSTQATGQTQGLQDVEQLVEELKTNERYSSEGSRDMNLRTSLCTPVGQAYFEHGQLNTPTDDEKRLKREVERMKDYAVRTPCWDMIAHAERLIEDGASTWENPVEIGEYLEEPTASESRSVRLGTSYITLKVTEGQLNHLMQGGRASELELSPPQSRFKRGIPTWMESDDTLSTYVEIGLDHFDHHKANRNELTQLPVEFRSRGELSPTEKIIDQAPSDFSFENLYFRYNENLRQGDKYQISCQKRLDEFRILSQEFPLGGDAEKLETYGTLARWLNRECPDKNDQALQILDSVTTTIPTEQDKISELRSAFQGTGSIQLSSIDFNSLFDGQILDDSLQGSNEPSYADSNSGSNDEFNGFSVGATNGWG